MTAIHETAYPRTRSNPTDRELNELFTPTPADLALARRHTKSAISRLGLLVLLKTFQRLGYFPNLAAIPPRIVQHIATVTEFTDIADGLQQYEQGQFRWQHMGLIRDYLGVEAFSAGGQRVMIAAMLEAAHRKISSPTSLTSALKRWYGLALSCRRSVRCCARLARRARKLTAVTTNSSITPSTVVKKR